MALIFKRDDDLSHKDCTVVSYGAFGELSVWSKKYGQIDINLVEGLVFSQARAPTIFKAGLISEAKERPDPNVVASYSVISQSDKVDFLDFTDQNMLARCISTHGKLSLGECYGFFPALALADMEGPMRRVENIRKVQALEHLSILSQVQSFHLANVGSSGAEIVREIG